MRTAHRDEPDDDRRRLTAGAALEHAVKVCKLADGWTRAVTRDGHIEWGNGRRMSLANQHARDFLSCVSERIGAVAHAGRAAADDPTRQNVGALLMQTNLLCAALVAVTEAREIRAPIARRVERSRKLSPGARLLVKAGRRRARTGVQRRRRSRTRVRRGTPRCVGSRGPPDDDPDLPWHGTPRRRWRFRALRPWRRWSA